MQSWLLAKFTDIYDSMRQSALSLIYLVLSRSEVRLGGADDDECERSEHEEEEVPREGSDSLG